MQLDLDLDVLLAELLTRPEAVSKMVDALYPLLWQKMIHTPGLFGGGPDRVTVEPNVVLMNTFFNVRSGRVHIGSGTFFGHDVSVLTGSHAIEPRGVARQQAIPSEGNDILIGKDCWIASKATILGPCTIEDNVIVAAGSVVAGGAVLESGWIYGGVPARKIKKIRINEMNEL